MSLPTNEKEIVTYLKSNVDELKADPAQLDLLLQASISPKSWKEIAMCLVSKKYAPIRLVKLSPDAFIAAQLELDFNPGKENLIELFELSINETIDKGIATLILKFDSNKYDAAFSKMIINIGLSNEKLQLSHSLKALSEKSNNPTLFFDDLKKQNAKTFVSTVLKLDKNMQEIAVSVLDKSDVTRIANDLEERLEFYKLLHRNDVSKITEINNYSNPFDELIEGNESHLLTDDEAYTLANSASPYKTISYRSIYENMDLSCILKEAPITSRHFAKSFKNGVNSADFNLVFNALLEGTIKKDYSGSRGRNFDESNKEIVLRLIRMGNDVETSASIESNQDAMLKLILDNKITPKSLNSSLSLNRKKCIQILYNILPSAYKRELAAVYPDHLESKSELSVSIADRHAKVCEAIGSHSTSTFKESITDYEKGTFEENFESFLKRHGLSTYSSKYEGVRVNEEFLYKLNSAGLAKRLIEVFHVHRWDTNYDKIEAFLESDVAYELASSEKITISCGLVMANNKVSYVEMLNKIEISEIDEKLILKFKLADLVGTRLAYLLLKTPNKNDNISNNDENGRLGLDDVSLVAACKNLTKKEAFKTVYINLFNSEHLKLSFKGGEKIELEDVERVLTEQGRYGFERIFKSIEYFDTSESRALIIKIANSVLDKNSKAFKAIFPNMTRSEDMRTVASQYADKYGQTKIDIHALMQRSNDIPFLVQKLGLLNIERLTTEDLGDVEFTIDSPLKDDTKYLREIVKTLAKKYTVKIKNIRGSEVKEMLKSLKDCLKLNVVVGAVEVRRDPGYSRTSISAEAPHLIELMELCNENKIELMIGDKLLERANSTGVTDILDGVDESDVIGSIQSAETLKIALNLYYPLRDSVQLAEKVVDLKSYGSEDDFAKILSEFGFSFNNISIYVSNDDYDSLKEVYKIKKDLDFTKPSHFKELYNIGIRLYTSEELALNNIVAEIFAEDGTLLDFDDMSLSEIGVSSRIQLIKAISKINPKFKKLLAADISSKDFVLTSLKNLDRATPTLSNLKEVIGVGIPNNLTNKEKLSLETYLSYKSSAMLIMGRNYKSYFEALGVKIVDFTDFFDKENGQLVVSGMAEFFASNRVEFYNDGNLLFSTMLKNLNKEESVSLIRDGESYNITYLKDAIKAISLVKVLLNKLFSQMQNDELSSDLVFRAMAGDSSANSLLETFMEGGDESLILRELSNIIKVKTVEISIARKNAKVSGSDSLAKEIHDILGEFASSCDQIFKTEINSKRMSLTSGFSNFNEILEKEEFSVTSKKIQTKYTIYFPENLKEVRKIGKNLKWCTSYNDSYFDDMLSGKAILLNLKLKDEIKVQGYLVFSKGQASISHLRYQDNNEAMNDFDRNELCNIVEKLIRMDKKLKERYL